MNQDFKVNESNLKMYQWRVLQIKLETFRPRRSGLLFQFNLHSFIIIIIIFKCNFRC